MNFAYGVMYLTGKIYEMDSINNVTAEEVYDFWGSELQTLDMVYGVLLIAVAVFGFYTRFRLSGYKQNAGKCVSILYAANLVATLFYAIAFVVIFEADFDAVFTSNVVTSLMISLAMISANSTYFKKRESLFTNP